MFGGRFNQSGQWCYDLDGKPITPQEFAAILEDESKQRIAQDTIDGYWVSTVYIGISFYTPPLIFETMIFDHIAGAEAGMEFDLAQFRYATLAEARAGHLLICECVRNTLKARMK